MTLDEVLLYVILGCIVAAVVGIGVGYLLRKRIAEARIGSAEEKAKQIADDTYIFLLKESDTKKLNIPIMHMLYTIISINCISSTDTLDLIIFLVIFRNTISGIYNTFI